MKKPDFLLNRLQKYSIRKFTVGTASILIGSLVFLGADAQAAEGQDRENFVSAELSSIENDATDSDLELKDNTQEPETDNETLSNENNPNVPQVFGDNQDEIKDNTEATNGFSDNEKSIEVPESEVTANGNEDSNQNEEKLFKVKETEEVEKAEAKDISNDIEVEAKLEIKDKVNAVPKAEHSYDIKSEYDVDMVVDVESDIDKAKFDFEVKIPPTAKEGDYFDVKYTRELTISPYDRNAVTNGRNPHTGVQNGVYDPETKELIATVKDIKENNIIRYTLTNYVERNRNTVIKQSYEHAYDYKTVLNSGEYTNVGYTIGDKSYLNDKVYIDYSNAAPNYEFSNPFYNPFDEFPTKEELAEMDEDERKYYEEEYKEYVEYLSRFSVTNQLVEVNDNKEFVNVTYFNPEFKMLEGEGISGYVALTQIRGTYPLSDFSSSEVKIYEVSKGTKLPESHYFNPEEIDAVDVTEDVYYELKERDPQVYEFSFEDSTKAYVVVIKGEIGKTEIPDWAKEYYPEIPSDAKLSLATTAGLGTIGDSRRPFIFKASTNGEIYEQKSNNEPGTFKENHVYYEVVRSFDGKEVIEVKKLEDFNKIGVNESQGEEEDAYTSSVKVKDGFKLVQQSPSSNILEREYNEDGSLVTQHFIAGENQEITYSYVKEVGYGRFSEEHHYHTIYLDKDGNPVDKDGNPVEEGQNVFEQKDLFKQTIDGENNYLEELPGDKNFGSVALETDGFKYDRNKTIIESFDSSTSIDESGYVTGDFVPGVHQKVVYNYYKTVQLGEFLESHKYIEIEKDFDGNEVNRKVVEEIYQPVSKGTEDKTFVTEKKPKDGFELVEIRGKNGVSVDTSYGDDLKLVGGKVENHYIPGITQEALYEYEKVKQLGRFSETHNYHIIYVDEFGNAVDEAGNRVKEGENVVKQEDLFRQTVDGDNNYLEDYKGSQNFGSVALEKDGFKYDPIETITANFDKGTSIDEAGYVKGDFIPGVHQKVDYNYFKTVTVTTQGSFKEHHEYYDVEKDFDGNVIKREKNEDVSYDGDRLEGSKEDTYTTEKDEKDGYTFTGVKDVEEGTAYNEDGSSAEGHYESGKEHSVTYEYEKVKQPGRFSEEHHYYIVYVDEDGKPVDKDGNPVEEGYNLVHQSEMTQKTVNGDKNYIEDYPGSKNFGSVALETDGFKYDPIETITANFDKGTSIDEAGYVKGDFVPGVHQKVVYNYFKTETVKKKEVVEDGSFQERHIYTEKTLDFDGNVIETETKVDTVEGKETTGKEDEEYTTSQKPREGFELENVFSENGGVFDKDGKKVTGKYIPGVKQVVQYDYEKIKQPGRFQDTHRYFIEYVDENGKVIRVEERTDLGYTNKFQEGFRDEHEFHAMINERISDVENSKTNKFVYRPGETRSGLLETQDYINVETGSVIGNYLAGKLQEVEYHYYLQVVEKPEVPEDPTPEEPTPEESEVPEEPEQPEEPGTPEDPEDPTPEEPEEPEEPGTPEDPEQPETPETPEEPEEPEQPETPETPEEPETPETPEEPEEPEQPETPETPEEPEEPETPENPEEPTVPGTPEEPEAPEDPEQPEEPGTPEEPETPEEPTVPGTPEQPKQPEQDKPAPDNKEKVEENKELPDTGEAEKNLTLFATALAALGGVLTFGRRRNRKED